MSASPIDAALVRRALAGDKGALRLLGRRLPLIHARCGCGSSSGASPPGCPGHR
ncbi:MAG: hypothetical protein R3F43_28120 [bacterium]